MSEFRTLVESLSTNVSNVAQEFGGVAGKLAIQPELMKLQSYLGPVALLVMGVLLPGVWRRRRARRRGV